MKKNITKKKAISLIELLISLSMTAILMLMLFGIVTKKTKDLVVHSNGVFYCWKDWEGHLYQKFSSDSIQSVSSCKIKIPKDAKNIQVFLVGGGAGGNKFNTESIKEAVKNGYKDYKKNVSCLKENSKYKNDRPYNKFHSEQNDYDFISQQDCRNAKADYEYEDVNNLIQEIENNSPFSKVFVKELFSKRLCYIPIFHNKELKYIMSSEDMLEGNLHYYKGDSTSDGCKGCCNISDNKYDSCDTQNSGYCYKEGVLRNQGKVFNEYSNEGKENEISYSKLENIVLDTFKQSKPGEYKTAFAEAGKEYIIPASKIGNGGEPGAAGGATQFGNKRLKANGGSFIASSNIKINAINTTEIEKIEQIKNTFSIPSLCRIAGLNCGGKINDQLIQLGQNNTIKINTNKEIKAATYENKSWNENHNPQKSTDGIEKTGFGLFGASAAAIDCTVSYQPIKKVKFNGTDIGQQDSEPIVSCATLGHGMGGAIIIKWD